MTPRSLPRFVHGSLALLCALSVGGHAAGILWQIGSPDGSYRELALAGHYAEYAIHFPGDVTYEVGRSKAQEDWPYIHPGPSDAWAGSRPHPFRIVFRLATVPADACRLNVHLVDSRHDSQQVLLVDINGRKQYRYVTEPGAGEASLTDPGAGRQSTIALAFPPRLLETGPNRITLTVVSGCWILYDAVSLETGPSVLSVPVVTGLSAVLNPHGGADPGEIALSLCNDGPEGEAEVSVPGQVPATHALHLQPGANLWALPLSAPLPAGAVAVTVRAGGQRQTIEVQQPAVLWRIGARDGRYGEFAIAGDYPAYSRSFPADVTFRVGRSDAGRDWPFIHPGPGDAWAGARPHPFRIEFTLPQAPAGAARLNVGLVDTQPLGGPVLEIAINDRASYRVQLPAGGSDRSLTDPRAGHAYRVAVPIAAGLLQAGANRIVLTIVAGSWMTYDDLSLEVGTGLPEGPVVGGIAAAATPLFRRVEGDLQQVIRLETRNTGVQGEVEVCLDGGARTRQKRTLMPGENTLDLLVPPIGRSAPVMVTIRAGGRERTARFLAEPERRWRVYVGPSTHTDIGYTDFQERVFARHNENTAAALAACQASPDFKWNLEVGFQAELFRRHDPGAYGDLRARMREGRIGLGGLYLNMLTGLCSGEELARAVTFVQDLAREAGARAQAANLTDVPTAVGTLPMLLSQSGVRYFAGGANDVIPFQWGGRAMDQQPYWWEGLDGSRVLAITTRAYAQAGAIGLLEDVAAVEQRLPEWLRQIGREGYPCDAAYVYGAFGDNQPMDPRYAQIAAAWNKRWEYPKIIVARVDEFFQDVEAHVGKELPVIRGDMGVVWEDGAASSARETALVRQAKARLEAAERWHALSAALGPEQAFPGAQIRGAWDQVLLFDEHTWGAAGSVTEPLSEQTRHQWAVKAAFAERAKVQADALLATGLQAFARVACGTQSPPGFRLVTVTNEHSWSRDIVASAPIPGSSAALQVAELGSDRGSVPCQREPGGLVFLARQVPPLGWRTYRVEDASSPPQPADLLHPGPDPWSWETADFRLGVDPKTGALSSLYDKMLRTEWAAHTGGFGLNQLVYVPGEVAGTFDPKVPLPALRVFTHTDATVTVVQNGPVRAVLHVSRRGPQAPPTDTYLILQAGRRIEFLNVVHKPDTLAKEAAYFAFPFRFEAPAPAAAFVELPYGVMQVEKDQAPGGCRDWYATNSFAAVSNGQRTAYLATPHAPMLTVNDLFRGLRRGHVGPLNGCLFGYVLNNYWGTNYRASQSGDLVFSFALRLDGRAFDPVRATQFGWDALSTMADPGAGGAAGLWRRTPQAALPAASGAVPAGSALQVSGGAALVGGLTWRKGRLVLRLYNPSPTPSATAITLPGREISEAWLADLVGEPRTRLPLAQPGHQVGLKVPGRGLATVVLGVRRMEERK